MLLCFLVVLIMLYFGFLKTNITIAISVRTVVTCYHKRTLSDKQRQKQGCTNPGCQVTVATNFVWWCLILVWAWYGTCLKSPFRHLEFSNGSHILENLCTLVQKYSNFIHNGSTFCERTLDINPYPTAFPYGNGMVLHFYQQQESSTTKTVHKVINKGLKTYV